MNSAEGEPNLPALARLRTPSEMHEWFESNLLRITQENPGIGTYRLFQALTEEMPQRIPFEPQQIAMKAIANPDPHTQELGKKAFLFLNARRLLSAVDHYTLTDDPEEKDELLQEAISATLEIASGLERKGNASFSPRMRERLMLYAAQKYDIPRSLIDTPAFRVIIATIEGILGDGTRQVSLDEINSLASELSQETGVSESTLRDYLIYKTHREPIATANITEEKAEMDMLEEYAESAVYSLSNLRERRVIQLKFGLQLEAKTRKEVAEEFDRTSTRIGQIEDHALLKLRHPSRSRVFLDYVDRKREPVRNPQSLMNGAINAFCQRDYTRAAANLAEIEDITYASLKLSDLEKEILESVRKYPFSYNWRTEIINDFISFSTANSNINAQTLQQSKYNINKAIEKLREAWKLKSKIPH